MSAFTHSRFVSVPSFNIQCSAFSIQHFLQRSAFSIQHFLRRSAFSISLLLLLAGTSGCALFQGNPNRANVELRKKNQQLQEEVDRLKAQHEADQRALAAWERRSPTMPALPPDVLSRLFTVHGLKFGRLTGGAHIHEQSTGDDAVKVYITPTDDTEQPLKAAGSLVVDAFDLAAPEPNQLGHWTFSVEQARSLWGGSFLENGYVLTCPLSSPPQHAQITLRVQFKDELTQAAFDAQTVAKVSLPTTRP